MRRGGKGVWDVLEYSRNTGKYLMNGWWVVAELRVSSCGTSAHGERKLCGTLRPGGPLAHKIPPLHFHGEMYEKQHCPMHYIASYTLVRYSVYICYRKSTEEQTREISDGRDIWRLTFRIGVFVDA